ncbi:TPA: hypothetical protein KOT48_003680 [Clostridioides difficile]|nr:hypothetical protein [Clostridioides difficile]
MNRPAYLKSLALGHRVVDSLSKHKHIIMLTVTLLTGEIVNYYLHLTPNQYIQFLCSWGLTTGIFLESFVSLFKDVKDHAKVLVLNLVENTAEWTLLYIALKSLLIFL